MRALVLALTLTLVASKHYLAPDFAGNKTYVYNYDAIIMGGLPEEGLAKAGVKVSSKVLINYVAPSTYLLKLVDPELFQFTGIVGKDAFVPATNLTAALATQLLTPIKFDYTHGFVGKIYAPRTITKTVLNIYRGILNVLQLNIKKTRNVYEVQEAGIQGVCKTLYAAHEDVKSERIFLTKTKDLNKCQERIMKDIGLAYTETCVECQQTTNNLMGAVAYNYVLKQTSATGVLIMKATVNELIQFSPIKERNGAAQMETKQTLVFREIQEIPVVPVKAEYIHRGSLKYKFASELLQTPIQLIKIINPRAQIVELLKYLVTNPVEKVHEDAPLKFVELIQLLRMASLEDIKMIWTRYKMRPAFRQWLLDAIPVIGTPLALGFIEEKYIADEITNAEAVQALVAAVHMTTADLQTIKLVKKLAFTGKMQENPILHEVLLLGYGTMVAKYCAGTSICLTKVMRPIHEKIVDAVARNAIEEIILLLKVLGNSGHPSSLKPIMKVLPLFGTAAAAALPTRVHAHAILALRNIAKKQPRMIHQVAVRLFTHKTLHPELRMLACIVLFEAKPPMGLVTTLANVLKTEENLQVASFTYSHMKSLAKSTAVHPALAAACNVALRILGPKLDRQNYRFSKALHLEVYNEPLMIGAAATAYYINDAATILPRSVVAKVRAYLSGAAADVLEIGVRTEGLQEALLKNPMVTENVDRITKMKSVIRALSQWRSLPTSQPLASVYVKVFGQEIAFANIDKPIVEQAIAFATGPSAKAYGKDTLQTLLSGFSFKYAKAVLAAEVRRILPTAAGLPMELSLYTAAVAAASVRVKAIMEPALQEPFHIAHLLNTDVRLETEVKPSVAVHSFAVMGVNTALIQATLLAKAKVTSILPAKIVARLDINKGNFKIEALPVSIPKHVAAVKFETLAIARNVEDLPAASIMPIIPTQTTFSLASSQSKIINSSANFKPTVETKKAVFKKTYYARIMGLNNCVKVASENAAFIKDSPFYRLIGKHYVTVAVRPVPGEAIEKLEMEIQVGPKAAEKIIKQITLSEDEIEAIPVLKKLKKILVPGLKNGIRSSSSSSSSSSARSISSSSRSSSSSSSRSHLSKAEIIYNFEKNHKKQAVVSQATSQARVSRSRSSASSFEAIYQQNTFLASAVAPAVTILFRVVRADNVMEGIQITAYLDKDTRRVQIIVVTLAESDPWKLCADGVQLSMHKVTAKLAWGADCKQYDTMFTAETGLVGQSPAVRLRTSWDKLPSILLSYADKYAKIAEYIPSSYYLPGLIKVDEVNSGKQLSLSVVTTSEKTLDVFFKSPTRTYKLPVHLPFAMPLKKIAGLVPFDDNIVDHIQYLVAKAGTAECSFVRDTLTTFNNVKYRNEMPLSCYQVLAQDCTEELKFLVLLKKNHIEQNHINVQIANIDIDMYPKNDDVVVKVNGIEIPIINLPYQHPTGAIQIRQKDGGISLQAPSHGLHEVYLDRNSWKVQVVDWMKGQTCGLCGKADGEVRQEYRTPNGRLTKSAVSYAHSWVLSSESCRDATECRMKLQSVKLEKQMNVHGVVSKCYSVEPVLRCLNGCFPVRTTPVTVGFHCLPVGTSLTSEGRTNIYEKSVDLRETTEAHVACSCTTPCA